MYLFTTEIPKQRKYSTFIPKQRKKSHKDSPIGRTVTANKTKQQIVLVFVSISSTSECGAEMLRFENTPANPRRFYTHFFSLLFFLWQLCLLCIHRKCLIKNNMISSADWWRVNERDSPKKNYSFDSLYTRDVQWLFSNGLASVSRWQLLTIWGTRFWCY